MSSFANRKVVLVVALICFVSGCHFQIHDEISGSGVRVKQIRDVPGFTSISTEGAFQINVVCQKQQSVEIEGDDNLLPLITADVSNGVLHIKSNRSFSASDPIQVTISTPNIEGIATSGASTVRITGLKNDKFEIDANGANTINVAGETKMISIDANGAGKIDAHKLRASRGVVNAKGVARVDVNVVEQLDVTVSGPAHVSYSGDPVVNKTVHGPGSVEKKAEEAS